MSEENGLIPEEHGLTPEEVKKGYRTHEEVMAEFKFREEHPTVWTWIVDRYYGVRRFFISIKDFPREVKWAYQRVRYGIADRDVWGLYDYIAAVMARGVGHLNKNRHGMPADILYDEHGTQKISDGEGDKIWGSILENIQYTFDIASHVNGEAGCDILIPRHEEDRVKLLEFAAKMKQDFGYDYKVLTLEEVAKFNKGFDLFKEHFFSLWD